MKAKHRLLQGGGSTQGVGQHPMGSSQARQERVDKRQSWLETAVVVAVARWKMKASV